MPSLHREYYRTLYAACNIHKVSVTHNYPRRTCAARVTVLGLCLSCLRLLGLYRLRELYQRLQNNESLKTRKGCVQGIWRGNRLDGRGFTEDFSTQISESQNAFCSAFWLQLVLTQIPPSAWERSCRRGSSSSDYSSHTFTARTAYRSIPRSLLCWVFVWFSWEVSLTCDPACSLNVKPYIVEEMGTESCEPYVRVYTTLDSHYVSLEWLWNLLRGGGARAP